MINQLQSSGWSQAGARSATPASARLSGPGSMLWGGREDEGDGWTGEGGPPGRPVTPWGLDSLGSGEAGDEPARAGGPLGTQPLDVCDIERGRGTHPSVDSLDKLATALGYSRVDLLRASGVIEAAGPRENDDERRMLAVYRDLTEAGRMSVLRFARFVHATSISGCRAR